MNHPGAGPVTVITGASEGIGRALALHTAARHGGTIVLLARSQAALDTIAAAVAERGARPVPRVVDVADRERLAASLRAIDAETPVDRLWVNAGVSAGPAPGAGGWEAADDVARLVSINLTGAIDTVSAVAPAMRGRGAGRIGLVSSVAARLPVPELATYGATKAGLLAYGEAIRPALSRHGVSVTVLLPGFVTSAMSARHRGPRPFEMPAARAAAIMDRALEGRRAVLVFPWQMAGLVALSRLAPRPLLDRILAAFEAEIVPDPKRSATPAADAPPSPDR